MCLVKTKNISTGLIDSERVALIDTIDGSEEVSVSENHIRGCNLVTYMIHREKNKVLVELPVESASGKWRIWVTSDHVKSGE